MQVTYDLDDDTADVQGGYNLSLKRVEKLIRALQMVRQRMLAEAGRRDP